MMNLLINTISRTQYSGRCLFASFMSNQIQVRTKMKSNKSLSKRFVKVAHGFKRKQMGRNHGNGRFSANSLRHLDSFVPVTSNGRHIKKISKFFMK